MINEFAVLDERGLQIEIAARNVVAACRDDRFGRGWRPKGIDEVAIVLESLGYSTEVIAGLWYDSLFVFAADVSRLVDKYVSDVERDEARDLGWFARSCRDYALGALYSGPWIAAVIGLSVFGAALWSSLSTPLSIATAIALGTFGGLVASGAVAQIVGRRVAIYQLDDSPALVSYVLERLLGWSTFAFAAIAVMGWLALRATYGDPHAGLAAVFFFASALFEMSLAPLYALRRFRSIALVSVVAIATTGLTFAYGFHRIVSVPLEPAVLATEIAVIGALVILTTLRWLRLRGRSGERAKLAPAMRTIMRSTLPYALFGACYFGSIVVDHIVAGFAADGRYRYRSGYELGCDIALVATIPAIGLINAAMESMPRRIIGCATRGLEHIATFDAEMRNFYVRSAGSVLALTALAVAATEFVAPLLLSHGALRARGAGGAEALFVLRFAAIAYGVLMLGLLNSQVLFLMSRPRGPLAAAAVAVVTNLGVGIALRWNGMSPEYCVFGLLAGVVVFAALTSVAAYRVARDFTFHYFAGF